MSGTIQPGHNVLNTLFENSPLVKAMAAEQAQNAPNAFQPGAAVPLASMVDRLNPGAIGLQQSNPSLPWYAIPGMFRQPPQQPQPPQPRMAPGGPPLGLAPDPSVGQMPFTGQG